MKEKRLKLIRVLFGLACAIAILWFVLPIFTGGIINIGNATGIAVFSIALTYNLVFTKANSLLLKIWNFKFGKIVLKLASSFACLVLVLTLIFSSLMITTNLNSPKSNSNVTLVILGCRVYEERASLMLAERINAAYDYLVENEDAVCILSGGQGDGENISEAECMRRYLVNKGIDDTRLYKEDQSTSTRENLAYSKEIIQEHDLPTEIAIVTNEFHGFRAKLIADNLDLSSTAIGAHTAWWLLPTYYVRELYAIIYQLLF